jgi:hypothetical protein
VQNIQFTVFLMPLSSNSITSGMFSVRFRNRDSEFVALVVTIPGSCLMTKSGDKARSLIATDTLGTCLTRALGSISWSLSSNSRTSWPFSVRVRNREFVLAFAVIVLADSDTGSCLMIKPGEARSSLIACDALGACLTRAGSYKYSLK